MSVHITYFVHGTTTDNEKSLGTGWLAGELSELGKRQAQELREQTKNMSFDVVYSSDLTRAIDTAAAAFLGRFELKSDARLRECNYGSQNGGPECTKKTDFIYEPYPNGESYRDVEKRMADFLNELRERAPGNRIAFVAHQGPQLALDVLIKGKTWEQAFAEDWRKTKAWQPGWTYELL